jgi:hypothetical protein
VVFSVRAKNEEIYEADRTNRESLPDLAGTFDDVLVTSQFF